MKTFQRRSTEVFIPRYEENGALQVVVASGSTFIAFHMARITMYMLHVEKTEVFNRLFPTFALSAGVTFKEKWWTILTYGWVHEGFFDWFTNMIWLYCFAAVLQNLAGYRQIIPLFVYSLIAGGIFYVGCQYVNIPMLKPAPGEYFFGAQAAVMSFAAAAFTLSPGYQISINRNFRIPLALVVGLYLLLNVISYLPGHINILVLCLGGMISGIIFVLFLKAGFKPAEWVYNIMDNLTRMATPDEHKIREHKSKKRMEILRDMYEPKHGVSQQVIDDLLDKISENGYNSLSRQEKELLNKAGKE